MEFGTDQGAAQERLLQDGAQQNRVHVSESEMVAAKIEKEENAEAQVQHVQGDDHVPVAQEYSAAGRGNLQPAVVMVQEPVLMPDNVAGVCCPVQTMYHHHDWKFSHSLLYIIFGLEMICYILAKTLTDPQTLDNETEVEQEESLEYGGMFFLIMFFLHLILVIMYFAYFKKRLTRREEHLGGPTFFQRFFCPVSTVYYFEENRFNIKTFWAVLLGCFYTAFCYRPTYEDVRVFVVRNLSQQQAAPYQQVQATHAQQVEPANNLVQQV